MESRYLEKQKLLDSHFVRIYNNNVGSHIVSFVLENLLLGVKMLEKFSVCWFGPRELPM